MADDQRLDGWKAIGNFLGRDRTTAIRWARERGLPVHRVPGGRTGTVYALESELSGWMAKGSRSTKAPAVETPAAEISPVPTPVMANRWMLPVAALGILAIVALIVLRFTPASDAPVGIAAIAAVGDDAATRAFSRDLTADLARFANASHGLAVYDPDGAADASTDYSVRTAIDGRAPSLKVRVWLTSTKGGAVLWSRRIEQSSPEIAVLRERVAANVVGIVRCSIESAAGQRSQIAASERALQLSACQHIIDADFAAAAESARNLTVERPDLAVGWAMLAVAQAVIADSGGDPALREQARNHARRAATLAPDSLVVHHAAVVAAGAGSPFSLPVVEKALLAHPDEASLQRPLGIMLFNAGYVRDSIGPVISAVRSDPTSLGGRDLMARRYAAAGRFEDAWRTQHENERLWPGHPLILRQRERLLEETASQRGSLSPDKAELAALEQIVTREPNLAYQIVSWHERAGDRRSALEWLARAPAGQTALLQWSLLFWPDFAGLRTEPAFFDKMAQIGLVRVWLARKRWPDFCSESGLKYSCADRARHSPKKPRSPR